VADSPRVTPRQVALADQLQARIAEDIREFEERATGFDEQLAHAKVVLEAFEELPIDLVLGAILRAAAEGPDESIAIHDSRIEMEGDGG